MTDRQLLRLLKKDPERGLRKVLDLYGGAIKIICENILRDCAREDVEEAAADTLATIWRAADRFQEDRGTSFKSYCYGITRKTALTRRKKLHEKGELIPLQEDLLSAKGTEGDLSAKLEQKEEEIILHETIDALGEPERSVFILRYFYFFKVKEIASRLELTDKKVENCLYRGKQKLWAALMKRGIER